MQYFIEHIGLAATDPATLQEWYVRTLSAVVALKVGDPPAYFLDLPGGCRLEIYHSDRRTDETTNNRLAGWRHLALRVPSLDAARQTLESLGVQFNEPVKPAGGGGRILFFQDPEGNLLHLVERPKL